MKNLISIYQFVCLSLLALLWSFSVDAQTISVSGRVLEDGGGIPGSNVVIKGTGTGTVTDLDGNFKIDAPSDATLVFSYIGYVKQEIAVGGRTKIDVALKPDAKTLDDVVVIGYGTARKSDLTGAVSSISEEDLKANPVTSADQALQGRAAGVVVTQTSGEPGGGTSIRIRGTSSITADNEPLFVIDGIPIISGNLGTGQSAGNQLNPLSTISPSDIVSIEVLKDASAAAIYGARAANGVILITTKRGEAGKTAVNLNYSKAYQMVRNPYDLLNASEYAFYVNEALYNGGEERKYTETDRFRGSDWQDELFRTACQHNLDLSVNGGTEKFRYAASGAYLNQEGILNGSDLKRYNLRLNLDSKLSDRITVGNSLLISQSGGNRVSTDDAGVFDGGLVTSALTFSPMLPVYYPDGRLVDKNYAVDNNGEIIDGSQVDGDGLIIPEEINNTFVNPLASATVAQSTSRITRIIENIFATYSFSEAFSFKVSLALDAAFNRDDNFVPASSRSGGDSFGLTGSRTTTSWLNENTLSYIKKIGSDHDISAVGGFTAQGLESYSITQTAFDFPNEYTGTFDFSSGEGVSSQTFFQDFRLLSYLGRVNYKFKDKYLVTVTTRMDGSSKFGVNNKWGVFPSGSVAWRLSKEQFIQNLGLFSDLKLRVGYGVIGNQGISPYLSTTPLIPTVNYFNDAFVQGREPFWLGNPDLKWESTAQLNVGLDMAFYEGRLNATVDVYQKNTTDLLLSTNVPFYTGFENVVSNVGSLENKGAELTIESFNLTGDFKWNTALNIATNKNTITDLAGENDIPNGAQVLGGTGPTDWSILREGEEVGLFFGYEFDGIVQLGDNADLIPKRPEESTLQPGDRKYKDLNDDGVITAEDRTIIGRAQPDWTVGVNNTFSYKNFDLNIFWQGVFGNEIINFNKFLVEELNGRNNVTREAFANRWTPDNPTDIYPRANSNPSVTTPLSDAQVEDGSYFRMKTISLGYTISPKLAEKLKVASLRIYFTGKNLITLTDYSGFDPEVSSFGQATTSLGADLGGYPNSKIYLFGLNLGF